MLHPQVHGIHTVWSGDCVITKSVGILRGGVVVIGTMQADGVDQPGSSMYWSIGVRAGTACVLGGREDAAISLWVVMDGDSRVVAEFCCSVKAAAIGRFSSGM